jgi:outer membrane protein assembly factor BamA
MPRFFRAFPLILSCVMACSLHAQTYSPQAIRIDAPPGTDTAEPLRIAALAPGSLTKEQIEAALQRIADTGLFADISYTVNSTALVIKLTPSAASQALPVRYTNFVWWQPGELEPLVEARVPIFHGSLPLAGTLTEQVEAVLVDLLKKKGVDAKVTATQNGGLGVNVTALSLSIASPPITVSDLKLQNTLASLNPQLDRLRARLREEDFDSTETTQAVRESVKDIYQNAGYLDVATTTPTYDLPHKALAGFAVDLSATVTAGEIYRIGRFDLQPAAPLTAPELAKAAGIKVGEPASPAALRLAKGEMELAYRDAGYFDVASHVTVAKDSAAHAVTYAASFTPGSVYHFASLDTSALTQAQQKTFAQDFHAVPGAVANRDVTQSIAQILNGLNILKTTHIERKTDAAQHTVVYSLQPAGRPH